MAGPVVLRRAALFVDDPRRGAARGAGDEEIEASIIGAKNPKSKLFDPENKRYRLAIDDDVLGIDILKREGDGALFALEINAGGNVWRFSPVKEGHRNRLGGRDAMVNQLAAWDRVAEALIRHTQAHAVRQPRAMPENLRNWRTRQDSNL